MEKKTCNYFVSLVIWIELLFLDHTPPGFPAPVTTAAGGSRTALHPCGRVLLRAGLNVLGFQQAPCGLPRSAGSAPSAGPESSPFLWLPGGGTGEQQSGGGRERQRTREMKNNKWRKGGWRCKKRSSNNNDESKRQSDRETEGEKHMQYQLSRR